MNEISSVNVLVDNESWILPYAEGFLGWCKKQKIKTHFARQQDEMIEADASFLLGCVTLISNRNLAKSKHNLVVHESALPEGKGFSPVAWQILEGKNNIPVCLIEALEQADSGDIWLEDEIILKGGELCDEWRHLQGNLTVKLCCQFIKKYPELTPRLQQEGGSFYSRRTPADSELNINDSIASQFNLLRVVDNTRYPAFFYMNGKKYKIKITACND